MSKRKWFSGLCLVLLGLLAGGAVMGIAFRPPGHIPPLKVTGDVAQVLTLQDPDSLGKMKITFQGAKYQAVKLADLVAKAGAPADTGQLYLVGLDGFASAIKAADTEGCYISFTAKNGWEAINLYHPNSSNVKLLTEIVVVAEGGGSDFTFNVIDPAADLVQITPGQLLARPLTLYPYTEGEAVVQKDGRDYQAQVFTRRRVFKISDLTPLKGGDVFLVMGAKGEQRLVDDSGYFEVRDNFINYLQPADRTKLERVKGVILQPPAASTMDAYYDGRRYLESGEKLLLVVLDGLTYRQYDYAAASGHAPFLKDAGKATRACGIYPLENNAGLAALLTGRTPEENGVVAAGDHTLKSPSIFAEAQKLHKKAVFLDAVPKQLDTEIEPVSVRDENADGSADDELFKAALAALEQDCDLMAVRFHAVDDAGRRFGTLAPETMRAVSATDRYLAEIVSRWPGRVIITGAQDGAPESFNSEAMFVPYWRIK